MNLPPDDPTRPGKPQGLARCVTVARRHLRGTWLTVETRTLRLHRTDGAVTPSFEADVAHRPGVDAVAVVAWRRTGPAPDHVEVLLRGCLRPGVAVRADLTPPVPGPDGTTPLLWEVPAGIPEPHERGCDGLRAAAVRELLEETGLSLPAAALTPLGGGFFPSGGILAEMLWLYAAEVPRPEVPRPEVPRPKVPVAATPTPEGDGSPFEAVGTARWWPLTQALAAQRRGGLEAGAWWLDAKTEIGLTRLQAHLQAHLHAP